MVERLQKILAQAGVCSRRAAEGLIRQGQVTVDGVTVTEMGVKVDAERQRIAVNGRPLRLTEKKVTLLLNKPLGYVTTMSDPQGRPIVAALVRDIDLRLFPVGRLDLDTEGALLMTNDGELAQQLLHPKFEINKTYQVVVQGRVKETAIHALEQGVDLDGRKTWPARVTLEAQAERSSTLTIIIHEGRKRQVRRMCEAVGHRVIHLKRLAYGNLALGNLAPGKYRLLGAKDLKRLFAPPIISK